MTIISSPNYGAKTLCPVNHLIAFLSQHQAETPASLHPSPACICTGVRTDGGPHHSAWQQKPGVVAAPPERRLFSQQSPGNICNSVLPLGSLTRALLMPQEPNTDYTRVMVNVASEDKEVACLWQKSHLAPSCSIGLYDWAGHLQLDVQALILSVSSCNCFERPKMWL